MRVFRCADDHAMGVMDRGDTEGGHRRFVPAKPCRFVGLDFQAGADLAQDCRLLTLAVLLNRYLDGSAYDLISRISVEPFDASVPTRDFHAKVNSKDGIVGRNDDHGQATLDVLRALAFGNVDDDGGRLLETAIIVAKRQNRARQTGQRASFRRRRLSISKLWPRSAIVLKSRSAAVMSPATQISRIRIDNSSLSL